MTPERLKYLIDRLDNSIFDMKVAEIAEVIEFLRECAKCDPVYLYQKLNSEWCVTVKPHYETINDCDVKRKRILYTTPQASEAKCGEGCLCVTQCGD